MTKKWIIPPPAAGRVEAGRRWRVPPLVAELLINRGLSPEEPADSFLSPLLKNLHPPNLLSGATEAAAKIVDAIRGK